MVQTEEQDQRALPAPQAPQGRQELPQGSVHRLLQRALLVYHQVGRTPLKCLHSQFQPVLRALPDRQGLPDQAGLRVPQVATVQMEGQDLQAQPALQDLPALPVAMERHGLLLLQHQVGAQTVISTITIQTIRFTKRLPALGLK